MDDRADEGLQGNPHKSASLCSDRNDVSTMLMDSELPCTLLIRCEKSHTSGQSAELSREGLANCFRAHRNLLKSEP
jgi:hypothetical protein